MLPLMLIIHLFLGATLAGSAIIVALIFGYGTTMPILAAGVVGFVAAFPASWIVAKKLSGSSSDAPSTPR